MSHVENCTSCLIAIKQKMVKRKRISITVSVIALLTIEVARIFTCQRVYGAKTLLSTDTNTQYSPPLIHTYINEQPNNNPYAGAVRTFSANSNVKLYCRHIYANNEQFHKQYDKLDSKNNGNVKYIATSNSL